MNTSDLNQVQSLLSLNSPWFFLLLAWSLFWKGLALWRAAKKGEKVWFVVLFLVSSLGLLEILYLWLSREDSKAV